MSFQSFVSLLRSRSWSSNTSLFKQNTSLLHHHCLWASWALLCRRPYGPMAQIKWVHHQSRSCFKLMSFACIWLCTNKINKIYELFIMSSVAVHMAQLKRVHIQWWVAVHELCHRAHGSVRDEFTINDELALSLSMSSVAVHMAQIKRVHIQWWVAVHELCRRAHGSVRDEFTIHDELALSPLSMSFMSFVAVHMGLWL